MRKICIVISARPSYSRVREVLKNLRKNKKVILQIILIGSALLERYGRVEKQIIIDGFNISDRIFCILDGDEKRVMAQSTGIAISQLASAFERLKPDIVVTIADRYETLATSVAASYSGITLAHIQGGEVTGSIDERVRHANTKLADIHFPASYNAKNRIIKMGEDPNNVFMFGCPSIDIASSIHFGSSLDYDPEKKYGGVGDSIDPQNSYCVALLHSDTNNIEETSTHTENLIKALDKRSDLIQTYWFWPNIDSGSDILSKTLRKYRELNLLKNMRLFHNMSPEDFLKLCYHSCFVIGNSSVGIRECSFLGVGAINLGDRQMRRDRWESIIDAPFLTETIVSAIDKILKRKGKKYKSNLDYGIGNASVNIANTLSTVDLKINKFFYEGNI